jgi:hypothetical protein
MNSLMELVCAICNTVRDSTKQGLSFQKLLNRIRKEFKTNGFDIKIKTVRDKTLNAEVFYANGYYDPEDDKAGDCPIELIITHNFPQDHIWYPTHATELLVQVFDTVVHEYKHQGQYRKRKFRPASTREDTHKEYLSDPDEIDAYSISITCELVRSLGSARAIRYLHNTVSISRLKLGGSFVSPSLSMYCGEFTTPDNPVIKRLVKKVYTRLRKVDTDSVFM